MLKTWPRLKIDLALIDIVMPKITGAELALHLSDIRPKMPIIFMSAYSENAELCPERFREVIFFGEAFYLNGAGRESKTSFGHATRSASAAS